MDCKGMEEKLSAYLDHQLSEEEKLSVDEHLSSCPKCVQELEELKKTITHLSNLEDLEPPSWLEQKIMSGIRDEAAGRKGFFQKLFSSLHINKPLHAFATLALLITAVFVFRTIEHDVRNVTKSVQMSATIDGEEEEIIAEMDVKEEAVSSGIKQRRKPTKPAPPLPAQSPRRIAKAKAGAERGINMQEQKRESFAYKYMELEKKEPTKLPQKAVRFTLHGAAVTPSEPMSLTDKRLNDIMFEKEIATDNIRGISLVIDLVPVLEIMNILGTDLHTVTVNINSHTLHMPESVSTAQRNELEKEAENLVLSLREWKKDLDRNDVSMLNKNNELNISIEEPLRNLRYFTNNLLDITIYLENNPD